MIFKRWVFFPDWMNLCSLPNHYSSNFKVALLSIYTPSSESWFSDVLNSLKTSICQVLSHVKNFSFRRILIVMNFPNADFFFVKVGQKILKNLKLILAVLELSFEVIKFESINFFFFLFNFLCFRSSLLNFSFLLFLFCFLGLLFLDLTLLFLDLSL